MTNESYLVRREIYQSLHEKNEAKEKNEITSRQNADSGNESGSPGVAEQRRNYDETDRSSIEK
ncbi:MAG: hypothetical protein Q7U91_15725 [Sideroxyarcus sp.]|nr:hypothetical protein [Sideroxyarcus sp.]